MLFDASSCRIEQELGAGDRTGAAEHFRQCLRTGVLYFWEYDWSRALLARMAEDPTWPPWMPMRENNEIPTQPAGNPTENGND